VSALFDTIAVVTTTFPPEPLSAEVDRQLADVREQASGLATRAALLLGASTVAALVALTAGQPRGAGIAALVALGIAAAAGVVAVVPSLGVGPAAGALRSWSASSYEPDPVTVLYAAKLTLLAANRGRLTAATAGHYVQVFATLAAVVLALAGTGG